MRAVMAFAWFVLAALQFAAAFDVFVFVTDPQYWVIGALDLYVGVLLYEKYAA